MSELTWREVARHLADRLQHPAALAGSTSAFDTLDLPGCRHSPADADPDNCPFCADRAAYEMWRRKERRASEQRA